jgi:hypothetical protein
LIQMSDYRLLGASGFKWYGTAFQIIKTL